MHQEELFHFAPVVVNGETIEESIAYSEAHSTVLCKIAARMMLEDEPPSLGDMDGATPSEFLNSVAANLQMHFLLRDPEIVDLVEGATELYLSRYPNERIASILQFVRDNPTHMPPELQGILNKAGSRGSNNKAKVAEKRKKQIAKRSQRRNRK